jgi:hypothetical protein
MGGFLWLFANMVFLLADVKLVRGAGFPKSSAR